MRRSCTIDLAPEAQVALVAHKHRRSSRKGCGARPLADGIAAALHDSHLLACRDGPLTTREAFMFRRLHLSLLFVTSSAVIAGCAASAISDAPDDTQTISTTQQPLRSSGYSRIYYSTSARNSGDWVGSELWDCDNYREAEGDTSIYYTETTWSCPDNPFPFPPITMCYDCIIYTLSNGSKLTVCTSGVICF